MRYFFFYISLLLLSIPNFAQNKGDTLSSKSKKTFIISGGYGYPNFLFISIHNTNDGSGKYSQVIDKGTYFLKGEYLTSEKGETIGIAASLYYTQFSYSDEHGGAGYSYINHYNLKNLGIGLRFNAYFVYKKGFHFYLGVGGGGQIPLESYSKPFFVEAVLGARFMFTKNVALYIEAGAAKAIAQGGLSFKF